jgi:hypothetical protein
MTHYQIIKPLSQLPPSRIKTFKILTDPFEVDFIKQFKALCVEYVLHNHTGGTFNYRLNGEGDIIDLKASEERMNNTYIDKIEVIGATDADLIVQIQPLSILQRFNAIEV